jgi:hypothetical protein
MIETRGIETKNAEKFHYKNAGNLNYKNAGNLNQKCREIS